MAQQLKKIYGDNLHSEDITYEEIDYTINGKTYKAKHYYKLYLKPGIPLVEWEGFDDIEGFEQWHLEDAYDDFSEYHSWAVLPGIIIQEKKVEGEIQITEFTRTNGSVERFYTRFDKNMPSDFTYILTFTLEDMPSVEPIEETIIINSQEYTALYYGSREINGLMSIQSMKFYQLIDAYDEFKDLPKHDYKVQPGTSYPLTIEEEQVYLIELTMTDGEVIREYYRTSKVTWGDQLITEGFVVE